MRWRSIKDSQAVPAVLPRLITDAELQPVLKELERSNLEQSRWGHAVSPKDVKGVTFTFSGLNA
jgi:hypothetical protein